MNLVYCKDCTKSSPSSLEGFLHCNEFGKPTTGLVACFEFRQRMKTSPLSDKLSLEWCDEMLTCGTRDKIEHRLSELIYGVISRVDNHSEADKQCKSMPTQLSMQKAAQAWCKPTTSHKEMDPDLAESFAEILDEIWSKPWLGNATTGQLLDEVKARVDLGYRTVGEETDFDMAP